MDRHVDKISAIKSSEDEEKQKASIEKFKLEQIPKIMTHDLNKVFHSRISQLSFSYNLYNQLFRFGMLIKWDCSSKFHRDEH